MATHVRRRLFRHALTAALLTVVSLVGQPTRPTQASAPAAPPGPDRVTTITVTYTAYEWWMATWNKNQVVCDLVVDHEGQPTLGEIYENCGQAIYKVFKKQPPCDTFNRADCQGYYLVLINTTETQKQVAVLLPPPTVALTLEGCDAVSRAGTNICENAPILVLTGQEPLPNEHIVAIEGTMDGQPFACDPTCKMVLSPTDSDGVALEFWAWSSYGDSSNV